LFKFVRIAGWCAIFVSLAGVVEFVLQRRYFLDVIPPDLKAELMANNPSFADMVSMNPFRNGLYRASSIFGVPLCFGEFCAVVAPFGYALAAHSQGWRDRIFGFAITMSSVIGIFVSGARGGYVSFIVATAAFAGLWVLRTAKFNRHSLLPSAGIVMFGSGFCALALLIMFWGRAHNMVLGGGEAAASNEARFEQWRLAWPHILSNPVTGHGFDLGASVVGYFNPGGVLTIDSYVLSLLVETGAPGLVFFFLAVAGGIWFGARAYLTDRSRRGAIAGGFACAIIGFAVYRLVLSQRENHTLYFLFVGAVIVLAKLNREEKAIGRVGKGTTTRPTRIASARTAAPAPLN